MNTNKEKILKEKENTNKTINTNTITPTNTIINKSSLKYTLDKTIRLEIKY